MRTILVRIRRGRDADASHPQTAPSGPMRKIRIRISDAAVANAPHPYQIGTILVVRKVARFLSWQKSCHNSRSK